MSVRDLKDRIAHLQRQLEWANGEYAESLEQQIALNRLALEDAQMDAAIEDVRSELYDHPSNPAEEEQWWD